MARREHPFEAPRFGTGEFGDIDGPFSRSIGTKKN